MDRQAFKKLCQAHPDWVKAEAAALKPEAPKPASFADLKREFPKASAEFIVAQMSAGATLAKARAAEVEHLRSQLDTANRELETAKRQLTEFDPGEAGLSRPLNTGGPASASSVEGGGLSSILQKAGHIVETKKSRK